MLVLLLIITISLLQACASSPTLENQTINKYKHDADNGDLQAQMALGSFYLNNEALKSNKELALQWFLKAAEQDSARAAHESAVILFDQEPPQTGFALSLLKKAAALNYAPAQLMLGNRLIAASPTDDSIAQQVFKLYQSSAGGGVAEAQFRLASMLAIGKGTERDINAAIRWYRRAAEQGDSRAQLALGDSYIFGFGVSPDLAAAMSWYEKSANQGSFQAQSNLGDIMTQEEYDAVLNLNAGARWYQLSAQQGHAHAQSRLGQVYEYGLGLKQDIKAAARWYRSAAKQGYPAAQCRLGTLYLLGKGLRQDTDEAERWFNQAAAQIPAGVMPLLGFIHYDCKQFDNKFILPSLI